jgi:hypothetical protein
MSSGSPTPKFTASNIGVRLVGAEAASLHTHAAALERKAARLQQRSDQMASPARPTVHELVNEWQRLKQRSDEMMVMHEHLGTWISSVQSLRTRGDYSLQPHADARELPPTAAEEEPESAEAEDADDEESAVQMHLTLTIPNECSAQDADDAGAGPRRQWQPPSCPHAAPKSARRGSPAKAGEDERRDELRDEPRNEAKDELRDERYGGHSQLLALQRQLIRRVDALEERFCTALWMPLLAAASPAPDALADASLTCAMGMLTPSYGDGASFGTGVESSLDLTPGARDGARDGAQDGVESSLDLHGTAARTVAGRQERIRRACKLEGISCSKWISRAISLRFDLEAALLNAPIMAPACTPPRHALEDLA